MSIRLVDKVGLFPGQELLGMVSSLRGERSNAGSDVSELSILVSLPLRTANDLDLGRGDGDAGQ